MRFLPTVGIVMLLMLFSYGAIAVGNVTVAALAGSAACGIAGDIARRYLNQRGNDDPT